MTGRGSSKRSDKEGTQNRINSVLRPWTLRKQFTIQPLIDTAAA